MAVRIHLQRVVWPFVGCPGATPLCGSEAQARTLTTKLANDDCDEDEELGRPDRGRRLRLHFRCSGPPRVFILRAAATGAGHAYAEVIGKEWMPYVVPQVARPFLTGRSTAAELEALSYGMPGGGRKDSTSRDAD